MNPVSLFLADLDPNTLVEYLEKILNFLFTLTNCPAQVYLDHDVKVNLELTLANSFAISSLKVSSSCIAEHTLNLMSSIASNLLAARTVDQQI